MNSLEQQTARTKYDQLSARLANLELVMNHLSDTLIDDRAAILQALETQRAQVIVMAEDQRAYVDRQDAVALGAIIRFQQMGILARLRWIFVGL